MAKPFKIFLAVLGLVLLLVLGGAAAALLLFDPNDYRAQIESEVKANTGRDLRLGTLELKIFPWLAVGASDVSLGNAPGFGDQPFAQLGSAHVGVNLLPLLLDQRVEVSAVSISGLKLNLARNAQGQNNWDDLAKKPVDETPKDEGEPKSDFQLKDINVSGVEIKEAALSFDDQQAGVRYSLDPFKFSTGALRYGEPVDFELATSAAASKPAIKADVEMSGRATADIESAIYGVEGLSLKLKASAQKMLQGEDASLEAELSGDVTANLADAVEAKLTQLSFKGGSSKLKAEGSLSGTAVFKILSQTLTMDDLALQLKPQLEGLSADTRLRSKLAADLKSQLFELSGIQLDVAANGKSIPGGKQDVALKAGGLSFNAGSGQMKLSEAKLSAAGLSINTQISGEGLMGNSPKLSGPLNVETFSPRELLGKLGIAAPQTADASVLKEASFKGDYSGSFTSAALSNVTLKLDQSTARGSLNVRDFASQAIQFALKLDQLDADRYLPPKADKPAADTGAAKGNVNDIAIPAETLDQLNAEGTLDVASLKLNGLKLEDVTLKLAGGKGQLKTQNLSAKLYGGGVSLSNQFTPGSKPAYAIKTSLNSLSTGPFLQDFIGKDYLSGLGSLTLDVKSGGLTVGDLRKSLNGEAGFKLDKGAVKGFNLAQTLRKAQATLSGNLNYTEDAPKETDLSAISGSALIVNGILKSDKLDAASPLFRLIGSGEINLVDETINYLAKPTIVETSKGEGGAGLDQLKGLVIPIKLSGSLFAPSYKIDLKEALAQKALGNLTGKVEAKKEELKAKEDEAKDKLRNKLNDKLNKWLKPKTQDPPPAEQPAPAEEPKT